MSERLKSLHSTEEAQAVMKTAEHIIENGQMEGIHRQVMLWLYKEVKRLNLMTRPPTMLEKIVASASKGRQEGKQE